MASSYFDLVDDPPTSIGALQAIERDLDADKDGTSFHASEDALRYFLLKYFSTMVVIEVMEAYQEVQDSTLGVQYFLRGGYGILDCGCWMMSSILYVLLYLSVPIMSLVMRGHLVLEEAQHSGEDGEVEVDLDRLLLLYLQVCFLREFSGLTFFSWPL